MRMVRILIVDDEDAILTAYQEFLEEHNFSVLTAESPQEGFHLLGEEKGPFIIITDIKFPSTGVDGFEFIGWVKKTYQDHEIIVISGHATMDLAIEAVRLDASDFIPKPCEMNLLLLAIRRAMKKIEMRRMLREYTESLEFMVEERTKEIKRMEAQLIQAAKLSAMGELAASICHELRQPLCGIMGFADLISRDLNNDSPAKSYLAKLDVQCERMKEIIENLRVFSHHSDTAFEPMDIKEPLEDSLSLFNHQFKNHNIRLTTHIPSDLPPILGNKTRLQQVFVNLISNARDALDTLPRQKEKYLTIHCEHDGESIQVHITDNGVGIDQSVQNKIFDPFFSTKSVKQGTGLGLSIARNIVADHSGQINLVSQPGEGSSFIIDLPIHRYKPTISLLNQEVAV